LSPHRLNSLLARRGGKKVRLAQHDPVGDRDLLDRFQMLIERGAGIYGIHHGDHPVEPEALHQIRVRHRGLQHRDGVR
jgi:hypothetical protein